MKNCGVELFANYELSLNLAIWRVVKHGLLLQNNGLVPITCRFVAACFHCVTELREMLTVSGHDFYAEYLRRDVRIPASHSRRVV